MVAFELARLGPLINRTTMSTRRRGILDICSLIAAAALSCAVQYLESLAAGSRAWDFVVFPDLGRLSEIAAIVIAYLLPEIPFVVVAHRILRNARIQSGAYRAGVGATIVVLAFPSFWNMAWLL